MVLGIDTSTYFEEIDAGAIYKVNGKKCNPLALFRKNGVSLMRIRLWVDPYDENKKPYLGGTCDLTNFIRLAKLSLKEGYQIILDFHYSDFWCDPSKQFIPKAWRNLNREQLIQKVYNYTKETLRTIKKENIPLYGIQIGNEITNGMLWPIGKLIDKGEGVERDNYETLISLLNAGINAVIEEYPKSKKIIHLERSADNKVYREFFSKLEEYEVDYDIIGASYYPYYHGTIEEVMSNLKDMKETFKKEVMIMELGYAFTCEDYVEDGVKQLVLNEEFIKTHYVPCPISEEGQKDFIEKVLTKGKEIGLDGIFYWEPLWIPGKTICWTSREGQKYINELGKSLRNEWANQALYDYSGNALDGMWAFKNK